MSARKILPYGRSHTSSSYVPSSMGYSGGYQSSYSSNYSPSPSSLYSSYALTGRSQASSYSRPTLPYARTWTGFNSVVAVHPSQLRRRRERRFHLDDIPEYVKPAVKVPRVRRMSSTTWETPKGGDKTFADVINTPQRFRARIDLGMFESFDSKEIDVNLYGYNILIYACKENPRDPNRPGHVLNRQFRLPDDVDLKTVKLDRHETKSEVGVDALKVPPEELQYGKPIAFKITDVTQTVKKFEQMHGF